MKRKYTIIDSEGEIFNVEFKNHKNIEAMSFIKDGSGRAYYTINIIDIMRYLDGKITLKEMASNSFDDYFDYYIFDTQTTIKVKKEDIIDKFQCGEELFSNISPNMKILPSQLQKMKDNLFN